MVSVTVELPLVPGMRVGMVAAIATSAEEADVFTELAPELSPEFGSAMGEVTDVEPPVRVESGVAPLDILSGTFTVVLDPSARGPEIVQVIGPVGSEPEQPDGSAVIVAPEGGA